MWFRYMVQGALTHIFLIKKKFIFDRTTKKNYICYENGNLVYFYKKIFFDLKVYVLTIDFVFFSTICVIVVIGMWYELDPIFSGTFSFLSAIKFSHLPRINGLETCSLAINKSDTKALSVSKTGDIHTIKLK